MILSPKARLAAALVALCAALGVAAGFWGVHGRTGSAPRAAWIMVGYFTNLTGLLVTVVFAGIALGRRTCATSWLVAGTALATLLVGIVQRLLLHGLKLLQGGDLVADILLHQAVPVLVPLFWLAFLPKGRLGWRDPAALGLLPAGLSRLRAPARHPGGALSLSPFLDVGRLGWTAVLGYAAGIAATFLLVGGGIVALDRALSSRRGGSA